jgi:DNA-binding response OmpR family regulator
MSETAGPGSSPFNLGELRRLREELASSHAIIETLKTLVPRERDGRLVCVGNLTLDVRTVETWIDGARAHLPYLKFQMLLALSRNYGEIVPAARLLGFSSRSARNAKNLVSAHVSQLRKFLSHHGSDLMILSVRRAGYRLSRDMRSSAI